MSSGRSEFTLLERLMVFGIILFLLAVVVENLLHAVKVSEQRTLHEAAVEYSALSTAFAEMFHAPGHTVSHFGAPAK